MVQFDFPITESETEKYYYQENVRSIEKENLSWLPLIFHTYVLSVDFFVRPSTS